MRRAKQLDQELENKAIVDGFISKPIYTYIQQSIRWEDELGGCQYASEVDQRRGDEDSTYMDLLFTKESLIKPYSLNFGVPEETLKKLNFHQFERYSDMLFAERFEGIKQKYNFTQE